MIGAEHEFKENPAQIDESIFKAMFVKEVLSAHNACRQRHGSPNLELDQGLTQQSQDCAQELLNAESVQASRFPNVGENIYIVHINDPMYCPNGTFPVNEWYQQKESVQFGQEPSNNSGMNFSQLVWKATKFLGVGIARNHTKIVIVCQYMPPGNINGKYIDNVLPETTAPKT